MIRLAALSAVALVGMQMPADAGTAKKGAKCNIVGTWTDSYEVTAKITSKKAGTATAPLLCSGTYSIAITGLTKTGGTFNATSTDTKCPPAVAVLTYETGSCTKATGTLDVPSLGLKLNDTWTEKSSKARVPAAPSSALTGGLR
jgi:hypothetical protein